MVCITKGVHFKEKRMNIDPPVFPSDLRSLCEAEAAEEAAGKKEHGSLVQSSSASVGSWSPQRGGWLIPPALCRSALTPPM